MATPAQIITDVSALMNDTAQSQYNNATVLPYLNMALKELQEIFEESNIPVTNNTYAPLDVLAGVTSISFTTTPALPSDLIEIQSLNERELGSDDSFIQMNKWEFLPRRTTLTNRLTDWSWQTNMIKFIGALSANEVLIDYIKSIFTIPLVISAVNTDLGIKNVDMYLGFRTASFCAQFIAENDTRAQALLSDAGMALDRELGIPIKGAQAIFTRRRPFRSSYKMRRR